MRSTNFTVVEAIHASAFLSAVGLNTIPRVRLSSSLEGVLICQYR